jgi:hypothetical protein
MTVLYFVKLLSDLSYYFVFANYLGGYVGVNYGFVLSLVIMCAAGALSGLLEKRGFVRLLPPLAAVALLVQCRSLMDIVVLLPPLVYLLIVCIKKIYLPDGNEYQELFSLQLKTLLVLPLIFAFKADFYVLKHYCLPALALFLASAVLSMRMLRHSTKVLQSTRFQVQNGLTVGAVLLAAWAFSSGAFLKAAGKVLSLLRWVILPVVEGLGRLISWIFSLFMGLVMAFFAFLGRTFGNDNFEKPEIQVQEGVKEEMNLLEGYVPPDSKTFSTIVMVIVIIVGLIGAVYIFRRMLQRRRRQDSTGFSESILQTDTAKSVRDRMIAPKDPREAVRWYYRRFLRHCRSKDMPVTPNLDSRQINDMAQNMNIAPLEDTDPLRDVYLDARYSSKPVTDEDVQQAKERLKRIKEGK